VMDIHFQKTIQEKVIKNQNKIEKGILTK